MMGGGNLYRKTLSERAGTDYDSSALTASNGEYLAADGERRFWYLVADLPSTSGEGSDSADDEPPAPGGVRAGLYAR
ncbi:unnamed protein product [Macrosiphum euphorbiae]|uniref:Uncharacterized protein n=1 Tax=Macrosiphum euphorbiae TaxID=13131 RepID=A0AAV0WRX7_9HEMI|nr:unnamed protein product [Macrosiphum euphorbiae]